MHPPGIPHSTTLRAALSARLGPHNGITVGAVLVPEEHAQKFRRVLGRSYGRFKAFERLADIKCLVFHLPPAAADAFEGRSELSAELSEFMRTTTSEYFSGVRHQDPIFGRASSLPWNTAATSTSKPGAFTFAEVFAGIGGFRLGLAPLGGQCVLASEIDPAASEIYSANFGNDELVGDITGLYAEQLPAFDLLTAGFPCQPFSVAGKQEGIEAKSGNGQVRVCFIAAFALVFVLTCNGGSIYGCMSVFVRTALRRVPHHTPSST
jgi:DNA (cytosine-5)-methyltransferase 1